MIKVKDPLLEFRLGSLKRAEKRAKNPEFKELWKNIAKNLKNKD